MNENAVNIDPSLLEKIAELIAKNSVILFMKGSTNFPRCGFSKTVVDVLNHFKLDFKTVNVLEDEQLREGIKIYSDWPTIPQLYIKEEFVGGCDILVEMYNSGELRELLLKHNLINE